MFAGRCQRASWPGGRRWGWSESSCRAFKPKPGQRPVRKRIAVCDEVNYRAPDRLARLPGAAVHLPQARHAQPVALGPAPAGLQFPLQFGGSTARRLVPPLDGAADRVAALAARELVSATRPAARMRSSNRCRSSALLAEQAARHVLRWTSSSSYSRSPPSCGWCLVGPLRPGRSQPPRGPLASRPRARRPREASQGRQAAGESATSSSTGATGKLSDADYKASRPGARGGGDRACSSGWTRWRATGPEPKSRSRYPPGPWFTTCSPSSRSSSRSA